VGELATLIDAVKAGDEPQVRSLLGANPALASMRLPSGESPVMAALYRGHTAIVSALIDLGAVLDVFAAAATGKLEELKRALTDPGAANAYAYDGWTPLHLAAFFGQVEAAGILVQAGADLESVSRNSLKNTPLHAAAAGKHESVAILLLDCGANPHAIDAGGCTAQKIAEENGLAEVVRRTSKLEPRPSN
jgi:ankyrin repeat protein